MKDLIKEVALYIAKKMPEGFIWHEGCGWETGIIESELTDFVTAFLAELSKRAEAVAYQHRDGMLSCRLPGGGVPGIDWTPLHPSPPIHDTEAIENRVAEACAKACIKEAVQIVIDGPEERAYNNATSDCAEAIRSGEWRKHK